MYGTGSFHPKLWLLKFNTGVLRVVISSANLYMGDWSVWGNQIWFKDFDSVSAVRIGGKVSPFGTTKLNIDDSKAHKVKNDFHGYLQYFLESILKDSPKILSEFCGINLDNYQISGEDLPYLIASLNGYQDPTKLKPDEKLTGLSRMTQICQNFPFKSSNPRDYRIFYQASSLGNLNISTLVSMIRKLFDLLSVVTP
jgi:hypothetical protein